MKTTLLFLATLFGLFVPASAAPVRYVQISTNAVTQQTGAFNVASGTMSVLRVIGSLTQVSGSTSLSTTTTNGSLTIIGNSTLNGSLTQSGGNVSLTGPTSVTGTFTQTGGSTSLSTTTTNGSLTIIGNSTLNGNLTQSQGTFSASSTTVNGAFTQSNGATSLTGALTQAGGTSSVSSTTVTGSFTQLNGATSLTGALTQTGGVVAQSSTTINGSQQRPNQPACLYIGNGSDQSNVTGDGTEVQIVFATKVFDNQSNVTNSTFTATLAGKYRFDFQVKLTGLQSTHNTMRAKLTTTARDYFTIVDGTSSVTGLPLQFHQLVPMSANDTAAVHVIVSGGTKSVTVSGAATQSFFSGELGD